MCYEFDRLYWLKRAEEVRKEMQQVEVAKKQVKPSVPAKPAASEPGGGTQVPVPA